MAQKFGNNYTLETPIKDGDPWPWQEHKNVYEIAKNDPEYQKSTYNYIVITVTNGVRCIYLNGKEIKSQ